MVITGFLNPWGRGGGQSYSFIVCWDEGGRSKEFWHGAGGSGRGWGWGQEN